VRRRRVRRAVAWVPVEIRLVGVGGAGSVPERHSGHGEAELLYMGAWSVRVRRSWRGDGLPTFCSGTASHLQHYQRAIPAARTQYAHRSARPTIQTMDELMPWRTRARHMTQYVGASMNITWLPVRRTRPATSGSRRALYFSESIAIGIVAGRGEREQRV
jgi:hypothetical protein